MDLVTKAIDRVVLRWEASYGKTYEIQVSDDAVSWTKVYGTVNGIGGVDDIRNLTASGRYVRMYGTQRGTIYGYSLFEFEVYGPVATNYTFDKDNRQTKVTLNSGGTIGYAYDVLGRLQTSTVSTTSPHVTTYAYQPGAGAGLTTNLLQSITNGAATIGYTYDNNGNIETITEVTTEGTTVIRYFYDNLNQLKRENNQVLNKTITYDYDNGGNILNKKEYAYTTITDLTGITPQKSVIYTYDTTWKDKLASFDGKAISYDAIGNPLSDGTYTYTWANGRQLSTMSKSGQSLSFKYNAAGLRTEKTYNGVTTTYRWVGDKVTQEKNATDTILYSYDAQGVLVSFNLNGTEYYYVRNGQGDITGILNGAGTQVVTYVYDSWGKLVSTTGTLASTVGAKNPYRYRGYRYDTETGLYYLQSRYYNPDWGRFLNLDAIIGVQGASLTHNVFAYCLNNPLRFSDNTGEFVSAVLGVALAVGFVAATIATMAALPAHKSQQATLDNLVYQGLESVVQGVKIVASEVGKVIEPVTAVVAKTVVDTVKKGKIDPPTYRQQKQRLNKPTVTSPRHIQTPQPPPDGKNNDKVLRILFRIMELVTRLANPE